MQNSHAPKNVKVIDSRPSVLMTGRSSLMNSDYRRDDFLGDGFDDVIDATWLSPAGSVKLNWWFSHLTGKPIGILSLTMVDRG